VHRLRSSIRAVLTVVGTLVLITVTVIISDAVAVPDVARDVIRAIGAQLVAMGSSACQKRWASRKSAQVCVVCGGAFEDSGPP